MRYGIPGFRTPRNILDAEIQRILDLGVKTRLSCRIGTDVTMEEIRAEFDAVFLGLGAQSGRPFPCAGNEAPNVVTATAFLQAFNDGRMRHVGKRVVVVGGGDTSIDVVTVARASATSCTPTRRTSPSAPSPATRRTTSPRFRPGRVPRWCSLGIRGRRMQANKHEVEQATAEGITIRGSLVPVALVLGADGRATALRAARCEAKVVGGKLEVKPIPGTEEEIRATCSSSAIGRRWTSPAWRNSTMARAGQRGQELPGLGQARRVRRRRYRAAEPADHSDRPWLDRRRRHRPVPAQRGAGEAPKIDVHQFDIVRKLIEKA